MIPTVRVYISHMIIIMKNSIEVTQRQANSYRYINICQYLTQTLSA